jgi:hypothetical protein
MLNVPSYIAKNGLEFNITLNKKQLSSAHDYWLYFIVCNRKGRGNINFTLFATKKSFPLEQIADHLAKTLGLEEVKTRLDAVDDGGKQLLFPSFVEGWALI